jgi:hypothetical protein
MYDNWNEQSDGQQLKCSTRLGTFSAFFFLSSSSLGLHWKCANSVNLIFTFFKLSGLKVPNQGLYSNPVDSFILLPF